jgi:hypothetical protein
MLRYKHLSNLIKNKEHNFFAARTAIAKPQVYSAVEESYITLVPWNGCNHRKFIRLRRGGDGRRETKCDQSQLWKPHNQSASCNNNEASLVSQKESWSSYHCQSTLPPPDFVLPCRNMEQLSPMYDDSDYQTSYNFNKMQKVTGYNFNSHSHSKRVSLDILTHVSLGLVLV